ncbi:MAG: valine--tRNA ligase [Candidatus Heimdallarchaeaceae archaeon]
MSEFQPKLQERMYDPKKMDLELFAKWQKEKIYAFNKNSSNPIFTIDTPPPYANAPWHMGSAIHYSGIDMIARYKRMMGYEILFPMGLDRNGLPVEVQTEKRFNISLNQVPRGKFLEMCRSVLDEAGDQILHVCRLLGFSNNSFEWDEVYKTDEEQYRALTQATFIRLFNEGLIYEAERPNNYCTRCQTTIADAEIEYKPGTHTLYEIRFKVKETGEDLIIATTRPELIPAIGVVIFNPSDDRYKHLEGKTAIVPLFDIEVPIKAHHYAKIEFGTGILMVCAYGDIGDVQIFRELNLTPNTVIDKDGKIKDTLPQYAGLTVKEARKQIAKDLEKQGYVVNSYEVPHQYPTCSRCGNPIEFLAMREYYLKQVEYISILRQYADKMTFYPLFMKQIWLDWLDAINIDWPISRRRYYGTEVPIWYCKECGHPNLPPPGSYYRPWRDPPPFDKCSKCGSSKGFEGDTRTFDTWMDSSISEIYTLLHPHNRKDQEFFDTIISKRDYISDLRPQGKDIVRTWLHYTMLRGHQLYKRPAFKHVWISGHVVDDKGEKMSKSKGNIVRPEDIIEKYGGDALRLFGASEASHGSDVRFTEQRVKGIAKFINKLYNIARFISKFPIIDDEKEIELTTTDKWILKTLNNTLIEAQRGYEILDFHIPARNLRFFTWELFASHYLELVKGRAYNRDKKFNIKEQKAAWYTLHKVLKDLLKAFAPIIPFVTDYIYRGLYNKTVHLEDFPSVDESLYDTDNNEITQLLINSNSGIWKYKKENKMSLKTPLNAAYIPEPLLPFIHDFKSMHNIENVKNFTENIPKGATIIELDEKYKLAVIK